MFERATRRVRDVAADRHREPGQPALAPADGQRVEQRLGRVLVPPVAGVEHGAVTFDASRFTAPDEGWRTTSRSGCIAFSVIAVSISVSPFFTEDCADRHVHHVGAEPLARQLEARLGAGRGLEEHVDLGDALERVGALVGLAVQRDVAVGEVEHGLDVGAGQRLDAEEVAVREQGPPVRPGGIL